MIDTGSWPQHGVRLRLADLAWRAHCTLFLAPLPLLLCTGRALGRRLEHRGDALLEARGAVSVCSWGRVCIGRMCRLAADTARDIFVGLRLGVGVSALG